MRTPAPVMSRANIALCLLVFSASLITRAPPQAAEIIDPGQGAVEIQQHRAGATGLSGIAHVGGDRYFAVGDRTGRLFSLEVQLDRANGTITAARIERLSRLAQVRDAEGVAFAGGPTVWVVDESGPALREHDIATGAVQNVIALPGIYAEDRPNQSLESLTFGPAGELWLANEEALQPDGPVSTESVGTLVRLQRLNADGRPSGQWAYLTDPIPGGPAAGFERSGVVDLSALPSGDLLVLERGLGNGGLRSRVYGVDFDGASDTSDLSGLDGAHFRPVNKRLLWEGLALGDNFEGMAVGAELDGQDRSLLLLSDDGGATLPRLYALRLRLGPSSHPDLPGRALANANAPRGSWLLLAGVSALSVLACGVWLHRRQRNRPL